MFRIACGIKERQGWEMQPSEFWLMSPQEWWWLYEINVGAAPLEAQQTRDRLKRILKASKESQRDQVQADG